MAHYKLKGTYYSNWLISILINLTLFLLFFLSCDPVINADDDFYFLYILSGGFGDQPSHILHYKYAWNPVLTWPIVSLFKSYPQINWYTFFLCLFQFAACSIILQVLIRLLKRSVAIAVYVGFFLFIESRFLLSLHYSHTSIILAISGFTSLLAYFFIKDPNSKARLDLLFSLLLIVLAGLLRLHTCGLYLVLTLIMGLFLLPAISYKKMLLSLIIPAALLFIAVMAQEFYYKQEIQDWQKKEDFRQAFFTISNHPIQLNVTDTGIQKVKNSFIRNLFFYKKDFITKEDLVKYYKNNVIIRSGERAESYLYWTFMESRVYLLCIFAFMVLLITARLYKKFLLWTILLLMTSCLYLYLLLFLKATEGIFLSLFSAIFFAAIFLLHKLRLPLKGLILPVGIFILSSLWMVYRIKEMNRVNLSKTKITKCWIDELNRNSTLLFISTDNNILTKGFSIWDSPVNFPVRNLIDKGSVLNQCCNSTLQRFGIQNILEELPYKDNVFLTGDSLPLLGDYYLHTAGLKTVIQPVNRFECLKVYQLKIK